MMNYVHYLRTLWNLDFVSFQTWAEKLFGKGAIFVPIVVACSVFGSANGGALVGSRQVQKPSQKPHSLSFSPVTFSRGRSLFVYQSYAKNLKSMQVIVHNWTPYITNNALLLWIRLLIIYTSSLLLTSSSWMLKWVSLIACCPYVCKFYTFDFF